MKRCAVIAMVALCASVALAGGARSLLQLRGARGVAGQEPWYSFTKGSLGFTDTGTKATSSFVSMPGSMITGPDFSISLWYNKTLYNSGSRILWVYSGGSGGSAPELRILSENTDGPYFLLYDNGSYILNQKFTALGITTQQWIHVAFSYANSSTNIAISAKGQIVTNFTASKRITHFTTDEHKLGIYSRANAQYDGLIYDFRYYNRAISTNEMLSISASSPVGFDSVTSGLALRVVGTRISPTNQIPSGTQLDELISGANIYSQSNMTSGVKP